MSDVGALAARAGQGRQKFYGDGRMAACAADIKNPRRAGLGTAGALTEGRCGHVLPLS